jgi:parvulin-like peptidyl-prolyl isomerase
VAEPVNAAPQNTTPRRRKAPPRRTPAIIEQRPRQPWIFGWGADLDRRQREAIKERIALLAGVLIAVVLVLLLGWGWYQDNVAAPAERNRINNQTVAVVGKQTITYGYFRRVALFNKKQLDNQLSQLQQQQAQLGTGKGTQAQQTQLSAAISQIQQELGSLPTQTETNLIQNYTLLQRASSVGVTVSHKEMNQEIRKQEQQAGGIKPFNTDIQKGGLTRAEYITLLKAGLLQQKVSAKLAKTAPHYQNQVRAAHILIGTKQKALAQKLFKEVKAGANFAALAKRYSKDPGSAKQGGDLGYRTPDSYVTPFAKAVQSMKIGEIRLVQSQYGWHIIKLLGRKQVKLTGSAYQQAQQGAFQTWLQHQEDALNVQRVMDVTKIPGLTETFPSTTNPLGGLTGSGTIPGQGSVPPSSGNGTTSGSTTRGGTTKGSSSSGKSTSGKGSSTKK